MNENRTGPWTTFNQVTGEIYSLATLARAMDALLKKGGLLDGGGDTKDIAAEDVSRLIDLMLERLQSMAVLTGNAALGLRPPRGRCKHASALDWSDAGKIEGGEQ